MTAKHIYEVEYTCPDHDLIVRVQVEPDTDKEAERNEALYAAVNVLDQQWKADLLAAPTRWLRIEWKGVAP